MQKEIQLKVPSSLQSRRLDLILERMPPPPSSGTALVSPQSANQHSSCFPKSLPLRSFDAASSVIKWDSVTSYWILIGNIHVCNGTLRERRKRKDDATSKQIEPGISSWRLQFHPASWIKRTGYTMDGYKPFGNWQYTLTSYNLRPQDSPIFLACAKREYETVRRLLDGGSASPFDVSPMGFTPLHVSLDFKIAANGGHDLIALQIAAVAAAPQICQLLIEQGADGNYVGLPGGP